MKRLFLSTTVCSLALFSCSESDNESTSNSLKLFTTSNTSGKVSVTDLSMDMPVTYSFMVNSVDADGAYYFSGSDEFILASRSNNTIELYDGVKDAIKNSATSLPLGISSSSNFNNAREIAVMGDKVVVAQDQNEANMNTNKLVVYQKNASGFTLLNSYTVNFKVWGIHLDGNRLYAVADLTSDIVVFDNFFSNTSGMIMPTKRVSIEGLVRTHGITFSEKDGTMVLTDVGAAASDSDGGIIVIKNVESVLSATANMGTIAMDKQIRIYGSATLLGNPLDVAYDYKTKKIYVAERLNGGGRVLTFDMPTTNVNATPVANRSEAGVSSVFLSRK